MTPRGLPPGVEVVAGPERWGCELRWRVRLADGRAGLLAGLAPELARELALRRRWVRDVARVRDLDAPGVARVLALGPEPDPLAAGADPPWRLREDPPGEPLEAWLARRAPAPLDEATALAIELADLLHEVHARGVVVRDLHPRLVVRGADRLWLTDIGLGRVDILSTRTAASLLLEGSPYAAPEQFQRTALDPRADLYAIGVVLYRALTGLLPRGDGPAFLAEDAVLPPRGLRPEVPAALDELVMRCLALVPAVRPASARELAAALRGEATATAGPLALVACQHCGAQLRLGQRLCLACGRVAVQFVADPDGTCSVVLTAAKEDSEFLRRLAGELAPLSDGAVPAINLVIGDARMYSKAELARRHRLPLPLFAGLGADTAARLRDRLRGAGFAVRVVDSSARALQGVGRKVATWTAVALALPVLLCLALGAPTFVYAILGGIAALTAGIIMLGVRQRRRRPRAPFLRLRPAPALPASDPLVARLAALLTPDTAPELRGLVGELALAVQRLVDHRTAAPGARAELDVVTGPVAPLVGLIEGQVLRLRDIDRALAGLDEGDLVRALATSEARGEPPARRDDLLAGLDRLRGLEDERATCFHRLLEAESLLRRAVELGLGVRDEEAEHARRIAQARHALDGG